MKCSQEAVNNVAGFLAAFSTFDEFVGDPALGDLVRDDGTERAYRFLFARAARPAVEWAALRYPAPLDLRLVRAYVIALGGDGVEVECSQELVDALADILARHSGTFADFALEYPTLVATPGARHWFNVVLATRGQPSQPAGRPL